MRFQLGQELSLPHGFGGDHDLVNILVRRFGFHNDRKKTFILILINEPVPVYPIVFPVMHIVEDDKEIGGFHFLEESQVGEMFGLMDCDYHDACFIG
jgi:hypothetical protein